MPTYLVSLSMTRAPDLDDGTLIRLLHDAAERASCVPIEVTPRGLIVDAEAVATQMLQDEIRAVLAPRGAHIDWITLTQI